MLIFKKGFSFLFPVLILCTCSQPQKSPYLTVKSKKLYETAKLYRLSESFELFDEASLNQAGDWQFRKDTVPPGIYKLDMGGEDEIRILIDDQIPSLINFQDEHLENVECVGGQNLLGLLDSENQISHLIDQIDQVTKKLQDSTMAIELRMNMKAEVLKSIDSLVLAKRDNRYSVFENCGSPLLQMTLLNLQAGNRVLFSPVEDQSLFNKVKDALEKDFSDYYPAQQFCRRVDSLNAFVDFISVTQPGTRFPELSLPNKWGNNLDMSRFNNQDLLLVVWDNSVLEEMKGLHQKIKSFRRNGLSVSMLSMDENRQTWIENINSSDLPFWHVGDIGDQCDSVKSKLGIAKIPLFILKNKEGVIVDRTEDLDVMINTIAEYYKK